MLSQLLYKQEHKSRDRDPRVPRVPHQVAGDVITARAVQGNSLIERKGIAGPEQEIQSVLGVRRVLEISVLIGLSNCTVYIKCVLTFTDQ